MDKLAIMHKQLLFLHEELRKVKRFHKESAKHFKTFFTNMNSSFKILNNGNLFNEIHYMNILNLNVIEFFTNQIIRQSYYHSSIHKRLKEEGNKLKIFEKELEKKMKIFSIASKKRENQILGNETFELSGKDLSKKEPHIIDLNIEIESSLKEMSFQFTLIRECIKKSFDDYIESLCSFSQTKMQMKLLQSKSEENYNDCSPIMEKKFDILLNLKGATPDNSRREEKENLPEFYSSEKRKSPFNLKNDQNVVESRESNPRDGEHFDENKEISYYSKIEKNNSQSNAYGNTFYTPLKSRKVLSTLNSEFKIVDKTQDEVFREQRNKMVDYYINNKRTSSNQRVYTDNNISGDF